MAATSVGGDQLTGQSIGGPRFLVISEPLLVLVGVLAIEAALSGF